MRKGRPKNLLSGHYGLGEMAKKKDIPSVTHWVHLGVIAGGALLGYLSYPYHQLPLGMTVMGAAGSIMGVGLLLLVYDLFRDKNILQVPA
jgi:hypothetical protein